MSSRPRAPQWDASDDLPDRLGGTPTFPMPAPGDLTGSTPWERAQTEQRSGAPINDAERTVQLGDGGHHRVTFALKGRTLLAECDCHGFEHGQWCVHLASLWWAWTRGEIAASHLDTGRDYDAPAAWLRLDDPVPTALDELTAAETDAFLTVDLADVGVRQYARMTDRSPGTVGNLLRWARDKVGGE
jgi:hypothetical protein